MNISYKLKTLYNTEELHLAEPIDHNEFVNNFSKLLKKHKAIHLRPVINKENMLTQFDEELFCKNVIDCKLEKYEYIGGAAPRTNIKVPQGDGLIFTANEAPADKNIPFHHELAQSSNPPSYISFYCKKAPESGGETPLVDSTLVYRYLHEKYPEVEELFSKYGVRYKRVLPEENDLNSPLGRSWKDTYNVENKEELESILDFKDGLEYEWLANNCISITSEILPAIFYNEEIKNFVFYNSLIAAFNGWQDVRNDRFTSICYGNGEMIDNNVLENISKYIDSVKVSWKWLEGDIIWIDNRQVMHARNQFTGDRKIYASIWGRSVNESNIPKMIGLRDSNIIDLPISFGLWKVKNAKEVTYNAIRVGYRKLDCACDYGNEKEVGEGIKMALDEGICKREDLHITSKLWNTYHSKEHVLMAFKKSLSDLKLDYLDLYLIHFPISLEYVPIDKKYPPEWTNLEDKMILQEQDLTDTWREMENIYNLGLSKQIGVSNFNSSLLRQIVNTSKIVPHAIQIELHPYLIQKNMLKLCKEYNMEVIAYSPLGAKSYLELNMATELQDLTKHDLIIHLSKYYKKSPVQILLRFAVERSIIPICKSSTMLHMEENINIFDFSLTELDFERIMKLDIKLRFNDPGKFCLEAFGTFCPIYD